MLRNDLGQVKTSSTLNYTLVSAKYVGNLRGL